MMQMQTTLLEKITKKKSYVHLLDTYFHGIHYLSGVLRPLSIKGHTHTRQLLCGFIAHLVEHCNGNTKVVGLNPVQSLKLLLFH